MGQLARHTLLLYATTTALAVVLALTMVLLFQPGRGITLSSASCTASSSTSLPPPPPPPLPPRTHGGHLVPALIGTPTARARHHPPNPLHLETEEDDEGARTWGDADVSRRMVPSNIVEAAAESNILGVIVGTLGLGVALAHGPPEHAEAAAAAVAVVDGATTRMVRTASGYCELAFFLATRRRQP